MSDDDDYERRRGNRDKFPKERTREFSDNRSGGGNRYGARPPDFGNNYNRRPRPDMGGSAAKRPRRDWGEDTYDPQPRREEASSGGGGALLTFKQFLATQDDSITDEDAIAKYHDYKVEHKRQQLHNFFVEHKDEEWFKLKYEPEESKKARVEHLERVQKRLEVFQFLFDEGLIDKAHLTHSNDRNQISVMDALVVKLEGGSDEDMAQLFETEQVEEESPEKPKTPEPSGEKKNGKAEEDPNSSGEEDKLEKSEAEEKKTEEEEEKPEKEAKPPGEDGILTDSDSDNEEKEKKKPASAGVVKKRILPPKEPEMQLHRTASIFLRNIAPNITKSEVETLCKKFDGFLRVGLADPLPERKYYRRGWVSYRRDVNIKEICWNLNNVRIRDCDLGAIVNRDLTRRIRTVNGLSLHKPIAQNDLRMAAKLVQIYDKKNGLYQDENGSDASELGGNIIKMEYGLKSKNPLLQNLTDYLIEEANAEEDELLGNSGPDSGDQKVPIERDDEIFKVLDRIILYLRLVHSVDYYNCGEYPHEDEMPNRCGLVHVRGPPITEATQSFMTEYAKSFETKLAPLLNPVDRIADDEAEKLGKKDPEKEVAAFVVANCQELAKDKWLCPLSGKKFKGPEFIRKHILNKHSEKLDEVRAEVAYFNNYIYDPKRPGSEDVKPPIPSPSASSLGYGASPQMDYQRPGGYGGGGMHYHHPGDRGHPPPLMGHNYGGGYRGYGGVNRDSYGGPRRDFTPRFTPRGGPPGMDSGRRDPREPTSYKDLDAPEETF